MKTKELEQLLTMVKLKLNKDMNVFQKAYFMQEVIDHYRLICHGRLDDEKDRVPVCIK